MTENPALNNPAPNNPDPQANAVAHPDPRFFWLTVFQYGLIGFVTVIFVIAIVWRLQRLDELANLETARGLITFVITAGTVTIAIMLALTAVVTRDFDKRIVVGKEILTILVAVLGTIVGFYYGASTAKSSETAGSNNRPAISVEAPKVNRASDGTLTLTANITGGTKPYQYSVKFTPDTIKAVENQETEGQISLPVAAPSPAPADIIVVIQGKDKNGTEFTFNKDAKIKTPVPQK